MPCTYIEVAVLYVGLRRNLSNHANSIIIIIIIIITIIIIEFFNSQLWLGNIHLSRDVVIMLGGLICNLKSSLQLNICQELQIFAVVYMYWGAS